MYTSFQRQLYFQLLLWFALFMIPVQPFFLATFVPWTLKTYRFSINGQCPRYLFAVQGNVVPPPSSKSDVTSYLELIKRLGSAGGFSDLPGQKQESLSPFTVFSTTDEDPVHEMVRSIEAHSRPDLICMTDPSRRSLLDGTWEVVATSLPLSRILPFSRLIMAKTGSAVDSANVTIDGLYQQVDMSTGVYDNLILFSLPALPSPIAASTSRITTDGPATSSLPRTRVVKAVLATRGRAAAAPNTRSLEDPSLSSRVSHNPARLSVEFFLNEVLPAENCGIPRLQPKFESASGSDSGAVPSPTGVTQAELRSALGVERTFPLSYPMALLAGWSDVTFLDETGLIRLMRGNNGGVYVLRKVTTSARSRRG